ncbi:MAG TPA: glycosyltransferase [Miltoncostaeaceae bacterium]|nr:glycosyltransferase [Miltoncostaeaceae bacterium]
MTTRAQPAAAVRPMHLAVIPQNPVMPLDNGAKIRNFHLFRALASRHRVSLLLTDPPPDEGLEALAAAGIEPVPLPKPRWRHLAYVGSLGRGAPVYFAAQTNPSVRGWLRTHADEVDAVVTGSIGPTLNVPRRLGRPVLVDTHNVEAARRASELSAYRGGPDMLTKRLFGLGTAAFERRVLRASARVYVCSADEGRMLLGAGIANVAVVPNGVDVEAVRPAPEPDEGYVLFHGDLAYGPNVAAAQWIAREIATALRRRVPGVRIVVAGRDVLPDVRAELEAARVEVRSPVADMRVELAGASVVLVPLRSGGGTRLKILEAFGAGRAVVSTALGAEGIEAVNRRHLLISDSAVGLADEVAALLEEPERRRELAGNGRRLAEERYGWDAIGASLLDDVESVVAP